MRIILDFHNPPGANLPASSVFLTELVVEIARRHTHHSFVFLVREPGNFVKNLPGNVSSYQVRKNISRWLGKKAWYRFLLPKKLSALKADLFVTADNMYVQKTGIPSCLFFIQLNALLQETPPGGKNRIKSKVLSQLANNAGTVILFSEHDRQVIQQQLPFPVNTMRLLPARAIDITELKWTEKEMVKIEYAAGVEYFVFAGDLHERYDLVGLLKAFSLFKKWQQSNMKLLIVGNTTEWTVQFFRKLASFKYRSDVHVLADQSNETINKIIGAAYAFIYPAIYDHFPVNILAAMQAGVPVITSSIPVCKEWGGDAVMYPETDDAAGFAKSLQDIYKDERLRSVFIDAAKERISLPENNDMAEACMNIFEESVAK